MKALTFTSKMVLKAGIRHKKPKAAPPPPPNGNMSLSWKLIDIKLNIINSGAHNTPNLQ